jgi:CHRD domain
MDTQWKIGAAVLTAVIAATGAVVACSSDPTAPQSTMHVARMSGANEVPRVTVGASGTATFTLTGKTLSYVVVM